MVMQEKNLKMVSVKLVNEASVPYSTVHVTCPEHAVALFRSLLEDADREHVVAMYLDTKHKPNAVSVIAVGTLSNSSIHPREVFKAAVLSNAAAVILAHNHPSGDPFPSREDIQVTQRLARAGEIMGINVLDHVVIGHDGRYVSLKAQGML